MRTHLCGFWWILGFGLHRDLMYELWFNSSFLVVLVFIMLEIVASVGFGGEMRPRLLLEE